MSEELSVSSVLIFYHEKAESLLLGLLLFDFIIIVFALWAHGGYTITGI